MNHKWRVLYRDGYGVEAEWAVFAFLTDAEQYVDQHKESKDRLRIEEIQDNPSVHFTNDELKTIEYVMCDLLMNEDGRLHYNYGSITIEIMQAIHRKLYRAKHHNDGAPRATADDEDYNEFANYEI